MSACSARAARRLEQEPSGQKHPNAPAHRCSWRWATTFAAAAGRARTATGWQCPTRAGRSSPPAGADCHVGMVGRMSAAPWRPRKPRKRHRTSSASVPAACRTGVHSSLCGKGRSRNCSCRGPSNRGGSGCRYKKARSVQGDIGSAQRHRCRRQCNHQGSDLVADGKRGHPSPACTGKHLVDNGRDRSSRRGTRAATAVLVRG